ncbi:hypothetical protein [Anaerococcus tetradius]|jgi:hypothetical protein|uniref:hypothetical protein n=1 Tax=Anaerococcus tetradius TaxID=33036 RepID=UPI0023F1C86E|nr:hypothetical protein [Anaerococcus tetradius]
MRKYGLVLALLFLLSACSFQSRESFEKELLNKESQKKPIKMPEISYKDAISKKDIERIDFAKLYKKASLCDRKSIESSLGLIKQMDFSSKQLGFVIKKEDDGNIYLDQVYDKGGLVEESLALLSRPDLDRVFVKVITFDSDSGPMLLVSEFAIYEKETLSAYYLYDKYLSQIDSFIFSNTTDKLEPSITRLGDGLGEDGKKTKGDIKKAIAERLRAEESQLADLYMTYGLKKETIRGKVLGEDMDIGHLISGNHSKEILFIEKTKDKNGKDVITIK